MKTKVFTQNEMQEVSDFCKMIGVCENLITPVDIVCALNGANIMIFRNKVSIKIGANKNITALINLKEMLISFNK